MRSISDEPPVLPRIYAHQLDVRAFHHYTSTLGGVPNAPTTGPGWDVGATRGWFARALWAALDSYWNVDRVL